MMVGSSLKRNLLYRNAEKIYLFSLIKRREGNLISVIRFSICRANFIPVSVLRKCFEMSSVMCIMCNMNIQERGVKVREVCIIGGSKTQEGNGYQ